MKLCIFFLAITLLLLPPSQGMASQLICGLAYGNQTLPALPEFKAESDRSQYYGCEYLNQPQARTGNWLPDWPEFSYWQHQSNGFSAQDNPDNKGYELQTDIPLKRLDTSTLFFHYQQTQWQQLLSTTEAINYQPANGAAIGLSDGQITAVELQQSEFGLALRMPYRSNHPITEVKLSKLNQQHPLQANILNQPLRTLYAAETDFWQLSIASDSYHRGLNINWQVGFGQGKVTFGDEAALQVLENEDELIAIKGRLDFFYRWRMNMRWHTYMAWQNRILHWQQVSSNDNLQLPAANQYESRLNAGILLRF